MNYDYKIISKVESIDKITICPYNIMKQFTKEVINSCHVYIIEQYMVILIPQNILNVELKNTFVNYRLIDNTGCIKLNL